MDGRSRFPARSKALKVLTPSTTPAPRDPVVQRLRAALNALESTASDLERKGKTSFEHAFFGKLAVGDYVQFNELHTRHHAKQLA